MRAELMQAVGVLGPGAFVANTVAAAVAAPVAASLGLWTARATDLALPEVTPLMKASTVALASLLALMLVVSTAPASVPGFLVCVCLAAAAAADRDQYVLPDALTLAAVAVALISQPFTPGTPRLQLACVAAGIYAMGSAFAWAMRVWRGPAAFGQGDVKLLAALGVILPAGLIGPVIIAGCISALLVSIAGNRSAPIRIPLGLHLIIGVAAVFPAFALLPASLRF